MPVKIFSAAVLGIEALPIEVEVDLTSGFPGWQIVGLADKAIEEAKERISVALKNTAVKPPHSFHKKIIVNLAPADFKKEGSGYDLAIAVGFLLASEQLTRFNPHDRLFLGELGLDGTIRQTNGVLAAVELAWRNGFKEVILPQANYTEATFYQDKILLSPVATLEQLVLYLDNKLGLERPQVQLELAPEYSFDISEIAGLASAKRALEIVAAGGHNLLLQGSPGTGKTLLAKSLPSLLPSLTEQESLELTKIYSAAGLLDTATPFIRQRPFRNPHHTASSSAIIGGGQSPRPGEISLAHRGVLFLDEFPEFNRAVIEGLRQPLEEGSITIARVRKNLTFPAKFILVAATNPCPCGFYGDRRKECTCSQVAIQKYQRKISGPILDRIDLVLQVPRVELSQLLGSRNPLESNKLRSRIASARTLQRERFTKEDNAILTNAEMNLAQLKKFCPLDPASFQLLQQAEKSLVLSPRSVHRILRVSRTIADLDQAEKIQTNHLAEAIQYRENK